jgi:hypothetical protein
MNDGKLAKTLPEIEVTDTQRQIAAIYHRLLLRCRRGGESVADLLGPELTLKSHQIAQLVWMADNWRWKGKTK